MSHKESCGKVIVVHTVDSLVIIGESNRKVIENDITFWVSLLQLLIT